MDVQINEIVDQFMPIISKNAGNGFVYLMQNGKIGTFFCWFYYIGLMSVRLWQGSK